MKRYFIVVIVILSCVLLLLYNAYKGEKEERQRAERNVSALTSDVSHYMTKNGQMAAEIAGLELSERELKNLLPELHYEISNLKVKLKNALAVVRVETNVKYVNRDSIVYLSVGDSVRQFEIEEEWIKARVRVKDCSVIEPGGFEIIDIPNTMDAVLEVEYKGWWFWRKPTAVTLHVKCSNPYMGVIDGVYVDLRGR